MKMLARSGLSARASAFNGDKEPLVHLRIGVHMYVATPTEAVELARQLVAAVDDAKAAFSATDSEASSGR